MRSLIRRTVSCVARKGSQHTLLGFCSIFDFTSLPPLWRPEGTNCQFAVMMKEIRVQFLALLKLCWCENAKEF